MSEVLSLIGAGIRNRVRPLLPGLTYSLVRSFIVADLVLGTMNPLWGWWLYRRWTRNPVAWRSYWPIYKRSLAFTWKHVRHGPSHTGLWSVAWRSPPVRRAHVEERSDYRPEGSCGTCSNCCKTSWLPPAEQVSCPFLGDNRCTIYGGRFWDYFKCGRYPTTAPEIGVYGCPRFVIRTEIPVRRLQQ